MTTMAETATAARPTNEELLSAERSLSSARGPMGSSVRRPMAAVREIPGANWCNRSPRKQEYLFRALTPRRASRSAQAIA